MNNVLNNKFAIFYPEREHDCHSKSSGCRGERGPN